MINTENKSDVKNCSCACVKGNVRENNEDNFYFAGGYLEPDAEGLEMPISESIDLMANEKQGHLFAVFDGLGGGQYGEIASYEAAKATEEYIPHCEDSDETLDAFMLEILCKTINERVYAAAERTASSVMGTTMAALYFRGGKVWSCNIGDSRCYRLRKGVLEKLSVDHVEGLYNIDKINKKRKPGLIQYLGMDPKEILLEPTIMSSDAEDEDIYLVCSDGLTDMVAEADIRAIITEAKDAESAVSNLTETALSNGGKDNLTVIVCRCGQGY